MRLNVFLSLTIIELQKGFIYFHCTRNTNILHFLSHFPNLDGIETNLTQVSR